MSASPRTFNYADKSGRLIPWIDERRQLYRPGSNSHNQDKFDILSELKDLLEQGVFDWQPSE